VTDGSTPFRTADADDPAPGPFGQAALGLLRFRLAVIPCGGKDGKVPLVEWGKWAKNLSR
jgi:hypothetical protein